MAKTTSGTHPSITGLILVPALITLAVTILRLVGELQHCSTRTRAAALRLSASVGCRSFLVRILRSSCLEQVKHTRAPGRLSASHCWAWYS